MFFSLALCLSLSHTLAHTHTNNQTHVCTKKVSTRACARPCTRACKYISNHAYVRAHVCTYVCWCTYLNKCVYKKQGLEAEKEQVSIMHEIAFAETRAQQQAVTQTANARLARMSQVLCSTCVLLCAIFVLRNISPCAHIPGALLYVCCTLLYLCSTCVLLCAIYMCEEIFLPPLTHSNPLPSHIHICIYLCVFMYAYIYIYISRTRAWRICLGPLSFFLLPPPSPSPPPPPSLSLCL